MFMRSKNLKNKRMCFGFVEEYFILNDFILFEEEEK